MTAENMNVPMTITTISEVDHSDHCIPRTVYNDSVWVDTSHIVVGLDGYSEKKDCDNRTRIIQRIGNSGDDSRWQISMD